jgi:hypothetical protein
MKCPELRIDGLLRNSKPTFSWMRQPMRLMKRCEESNVQPMHSLQQPNGIIPFCVFSLATALFWGKASALHAELADFTDSLQQRWWRSSCVLLKLSVCHPAFFPAIDPEGPSMSRRIKYNFSA